MSGLNIWVVHMELVIEVMRTVCQRSNIFGNLKPWEERLTSHPEFQIIYLKALFIGSHFLSHSSPSVGLIQSSQATAVLWKGEAFLLWGQNLGARRETSSYRATGERCGSVVFAIHSKKVLSNYYLLTHILFSYTVGLMLLPSRGKVLNSLPLHLVLWWKWHTLCFRNSVIKGYIASAWFWDTHL